MARVSFFEMNVVTIAINDLFDFEGQAVPAVRPDNDAISAMVKRQFAFLPQPLDIEVGDASVTVSFPAESKNAQAEAARLAERAAKRATEGDSAKAISLLKRVLDLQPSFHQARRDLAMNCMEVGDVESAKNHLIEVLRLNPGDAWSWVVLGNIYAADPKEWPTAEKFFRRALEISANDPWALNGLAAITGQRVAQFPRQHHLACVRATERAIRPKSLLVPGINALPTENLLQMLGKRLLDEPVLAVYVGVGHALKDARCYPVKESNGKRPACIIQDAGKSCGQYNSV